jgi:hypothetical protein
MGVGTVCDESLGLEGMGNKFTRYMLTVSLEHEDEHEHEDDLPR